MGEIDITFRNVLRKLPGPILQLAFPGNHVEPAGPLDSSIDRPRARTTDNFFRVRSGGRDAAVHVEIEREWRPGMQRRMFDYASAGITATRLPVSSILLLLRPGGKPPSGTGVYRIPGIVGDTVVYSYQVIPLWQLDARQMYSHLGLEAAPIIVAMRDADDAFIGTLAYDVLHSERMSPDEKRDTFDLMYSVVAATFGTQAVKRILHMMESIMQHPSVLELKREWEAKGEAKGEVRATKAALYKVLAARSFPLTQELRTRIDNEPDSDCLESWLEAALTVATIDDVFRPR